MKRFLEAVVVCLLVAGSAVGAPTVTVGGVGGPYPVPGWAVGYWLTPNSELGVVLSSDSSFSSFSVQMEVPREALVSQRAYSVAVTNVVMESGVQLTPGAAYLYAEFRRGTLAGYDNVPGPGRRASARAVQAAIWHLQRGSGSVDVDLALLNANPVWDNAAQDSNEAVLAGQFGDAAMNSGWTSIGRARVLNFCSPSGGGSMDRRDMLGLIVPPPGAIVLGGLGLGLLGSLRRRSVL